MAIHPISSSTNQTCVNCQIDSSFDKEYGLCVPNEVILEPKSCCYQTGIRQDSETGEYYNVEINPENGTSTDRPFESAGTFGFETVANALDGEFETTRILVNSGGLVGQREVITNFRKRKRRQSATEDSQVENPAVCVTTDEAVIFDITLNDIDRNWSKFQHSYQNTVHESLIF
jgi:hypothetical protein